MVSEWCKEQSSVLLMLKSQLIQDLSLHSLMFSWMTLPRAHTHLFSLIDFWGGDEEWFLKLNLRDSILGSCCFQLTGTRALVRYQECARAVLASRNLWGVAASALPWPGTQIECVCVSSFCHPLTSPDVLSYPNLSQLLSAAASSAGVHWVLLNLEQCTEPSANFPSLNPSIL